MAARSTTIHLRRTGGKEPYPHESLCGMRGKAIGAAGTYRTAEGAVFSLARDPIHQREMLGAPGNSHACGACRRILLKVSGK